MNKIIPEISHRVIVAYLQTWYDWGWITRGQYDGAIKSMGLEGIR